MTSAMCDAFDEVQFTAWVKQASELPGEKL
jgi:hypothetical protein